MDIFEVIQKEMDEKIVQLREYLSSGKAATYEEYKQTCGEIKGLLYARQFALDLKRNVEERDD